MKKLLLCLAALFTLTFCFGFKSLAYDSSNLATFKADFQSHYNHSLSDAQANQILTKWEQTGMRYCVTYCNNDSSYNLRCGFSTNVGGSGTNYRINAPFYSSGENGGGYITSGTSMTWSGWRYASSGYEDFNVYGYKWDSEIYLAEPIDWDNPLYSANIPTPNYEITYRTLSATPIVDVPLNVNVTNGRETLFIEIKACFELPRRIYVDYDRQFGRFVYSGASRSLAVWEDVVSKEDLRSSNNTSVDYIHTQLVSAWEDNYDAVSLSDDDWYFSDLIPSAQYSTIKARYANLRKVCCFYGNQMKIMVRYFSIQNDTQFVVGAWRVWENSDPNNFYDELPEYYEPYFPASGSSGTLISVESTPDPETVIPPGSGTPTGTYYTPGINITVGQNVPNYPDYPTIRSYNADNFLVQTMNYLDYLNDPDTEHDLFGEFGGFLKSVFVFIPGEIWTIIAVGFCLVIVVMFLKIL